MDTPSNYFYTAGAGDCGFICMRIFMSFFFIPFFNIPIAFLILPWAINVPVMAAGMYPMAIIFFLFTTCFLIRPNFEKKWLSMNELKEKL